MGKMTASLERVLTALVALSLFGGCTHVQIPPHWLKASLWATGSAEYAAVTLQTYSAAREKLDQALLDPTWTACLEQSEGYEDLPPAIIIDLDETVLDNRPFQVNLIRKGLEFDEAMWNDWVRQSRVEAIPGAVEFLLYVHERGVEIFYLTNREHMVEEATRANLVRLGLPLNPEIDTVLTKHERADWGSDKESRRKLIADSHRVLLIVGDHLRDFTAVEGFSREERRDTTFEHTAMWGEKWFMLPNPLYGGWVRAPSIEDP
jgi:5'-nucleotidase (lipoprotein e(P4) family)